VTKAVAFRHTAPEIAWVYQAVIYIRVPTYRCPWVQRISQTLTIFGYKFGATRAHLTLKNIFVYSTMEYAKPQKLPDGRYFLRISGARHQVNGLVLQDSLASKSVNFKVPAGVDLFSKIDEELLTAKLEWFGKDLSDETITNAFQESVTDEVLGASLATVKGEVVTMAYDTQKNPVALQDIKTGATVDALLELSGLWFLKKSFGPIWRVAQVRVRGVAKPVPAREYLFTDEPEEDEDPADYLD
jgi:Family of unknown function (DUF5871)